MVRIGIVGASGFTGVELLRLAAQHPQFEVAIATGDSQAGVRAADLYPSLAAAYPGLVFEAFDIDLVTGLDLVFLGLPHEASMGLAPQLVGKVGCVVDLSAAYRLKDPSHYPAYYGFEHDQPALLDAAVYGLPELHRDELKGAQLIATPGCYVTAATLALRPLVESGTIETTGVIVDAASGVTGAGRKADYGYSFTTVDENFSAYGLLNHRHTPEMEQEIGAQLLFTPHLAPMSRGILATCYARPVDGSSLSTQALLALLRRRWRDEPFMVVTDDSPSTKATLGSNAVHVTAPLRRPHRHGRRHRRPRQPRQGGQWRSGPGCQRGARARGDRRPHQDRRGTVIDTATQKAALLVEALPYIRRFAGKIVVVKYGGNALAGTTEHDALALFAEDIVLMRLVGMQPVVVHGGGPQISDLMARLGKTPEFRNGLRVTDAETVDIARMVLIGQVNPQIVSAINVHGNYAVGVSGEDGGLIKASVRDPELGFVGDVETINPEVLLGLLDDEFIPVIATVGTDATGQAYNINADTVAGAIAEALGAEKLVYLTDIEGLRRDLDDPASLIRQATADEIDSLIADGTIAGGMIPKVESCTHAVRNGVRNAHILDGRIAHVLLLEIFTDQGIGTMLSRGNTP